MKEGRYKTNVKPPYLECKECSYRAPDYDFKHGAWWWKDNYCPKCQSKDIGEATKRAAPPPSPFKSRFTNDERKVLNFIYKRMSNFHLENPNVDYMVKFKQIIDSR